MDASGIAEVYDLLILVDATASMTHYLAALNQSLQQIISISALTNCFERIGLLAYRDYTDSDLVEWSGWRTADADCRDDQPDLVQKAKTLRAHGGGDYPEATKTGLAFAYTVMRPEATTLILLFTDAPPHASMGEDTGYSNASKEQTALLLKDSYDGCGHLFADWVSAAHTLAKGDKKAQVVCVLDDCYRVVRQGHYNYLTAITNGTCLSLTKSDPRQISEVTIAVLLAWMGVKKDGMADSSLPAKVISYHSDSDIHSFQGESDLSAKRFFNPDSRHEDSIKLTTAMLGSTLLETVLPKKKTPLRDFAKSYKESGAYRSLVTSHLREIVERDVTAVSLNPVFGSLWRTFCNDRENDHRQELLDAFGLKVDAIRDAKEKAEMKAWLEESYDYTAEVLEAIERVPEVSRFPCVYLDPTLAFTASAKEEEGEDGEEYRPITDFRRDELLELGRSCDWRILRRLGRILTRLTFVESPEAMQAHIKATNQETVTKIPLALAEPRYGRKLWRLLLHLVVPGTILSGRAAALLAALTIRLGVAPLQSAAETELLLWRDRWNDLEVPETWSVNCLSLLMDADDAYQGQDPQLEKLSLSAVHGLLNEKDRELFERLVDYKLLEMNLNTTLHARVAWTPQKVLMPVGPLVVCRACKLPRSVTIMGPDSMCGICCYRAADPKESEADAEIAFGVTEQDNELTPAHWFECNVTICGGQYIVYNTAGLNVRAKCHYCRNGSTAPMLECVKCLSRMIWPEEYRHKEESEFHCIGCQNEKATIVESETTASHLREENGTSWLLANKDAKLASPFNGRTLFHTASTAKPLDDFVDRVSVLPSRDTAASDLRLRGKLIRNTSELVQELYSWVSRRRTESGTCSLCFGNFKKNDLLPACGRSGCRQSICQACLEGWYGLNAAGNIINTAALHCPFCRRAPTTKTLARNGSGVHALGGLADAVAHSGAWIYAWCASCGLAKQYMERVCAAGAPPELENWHCDECRIAKGDLRIKPCPGCGIDTEKSGGCDHIQCSQCQTHWCFFCGEKQDEDNIYVHMNVEHGGYYNGQEEEGDEEEYGDMGDTVD